MNRNPVINGWLSREMKIFHKIKTSHLIKIFLVINMPHSIQNNQLLHLILIQNSFLLNFIHFKIKLLDHLQNKISLKMIISFIFQLGQSLLIQEDSLFQISKKHPICTAKIISLQSLKI